jgi:hypothetical protein
MMVAKPEKAEGLILRLPKIKASLTNKTANRRQAQQKNATTNTAPGFGMSSVDFSKPSMLSAALNDKMTEDEERAQGGRHGTKV